MFVERPCRLRLLSVAEPRLPFLSVVVFFFFSEIPRRGRDLGDLLARLASRQVARLSDDTLVILPLPSHFDCFECGPPSHRSLSSAL
ncbi:unnamed protein product [Caenorhabditis auriculariae]|uniref:Uncharacterized protein n=1 Tax=Caenorhabditis auriculariae TaxID=2777116 RepID=A0A8S1HDK3_9PELO|nr:unnamed protein product [Caenorhabditis auriculariae]